MKYTADVKLFCDFSVNVYFHPIFAADDQSN